MDDNVHTIEQFYGVYLLYCLNPKYKGRTYIGYTVDPNRRIKQHNKGKKAGGAWRTSKRGPWTMVLIVHGFPNDITALRFEWAWQHPNRSRRLSHLPRKKARETVYDYALRVLAEMFRVGPWLRLPLTIRWLNQEFARDFPSDKLPPFHMPVCYGPVVSKKLKCGSGDHGPNQSSTCVVCSGDIDEKPLVCLSPDCDLVSHIVCLSKSFLEPGEL
ncbi:structure-specific endonuclease subunit slx1-like [Photinus pyralis]|uniref:structure-specific endonuclease subunit slx1-like n=1 Tax=Photinus pyralis TaxID=7054 RepID=UPI00126751D2|nr:structure-specific endonuclease subunit slx1-like [Photinus pyralis]